jgi:hypothetical protein
VWRLSFLSGFFAGAALFGCLLMVLASPCFDIGLAVLPAAPRLLVVCLRRWTFLDLILVY